MLIKYLNELERAVQGAMADPSAQRYEDCLECVARLEAYLQSQLEPVRAKGFQIMGELLPSQLSDWMGMARHTPPSH